MKKIILNTFCFLFTSFCFAQANKSEEIEAKIKNIVATQSFLPETKQGTLLNKNGKEVPYNVSFYYFLDTEKLFSVLYEQHDEISVSKTFYYDNDQLVLIIIEQINNKVAKDRIIEQVFYFFDNGELIDLSDVNTTYNTADLYKEGMNYYNDFK